MFECASIPFMSHTTFYKIQKQKVSPAIHCMFTTQRQVLFDEARECGKLDVLGDGECNAN